MQIDAQKFYDSSWGLHLVWAAVLQAGGCVTVLFTLLGPSMLAGLALMALLVPLNGRLVQWQHRQRKIASARSDARVTAINEVLQAIRTVKLYSWERHFEAQISQLREQELVYIRRLGINKAIISTLATITPAIVTLAALVAYTQLAGHTLDAATVFTAIALFENMKDPLSRIPDRVASFVDLAVASNRISAFLACEESDNSRTVPAPVVSDDDTHAVELRGSFGWGDIAGVDVGSQPRVPKPHQIVSRRPGKMKYTAISTDEAADSTSVAMLVVDPGLVVPHGSLVYVVGTVGSGKSNLLSAILSEMSPASPGSVSNTAGNVAFMGQTPWILNMSLKQNVTICGCLDPVDEARYAEALRVSGLVDDLSAFAAGDQTEIGAKGINISGGQKQRVCLARMVYSEMSICILDDPTSALDAVMANYVLDQAVHGVLARQKRTRIVVTNQLSALEHADQILWLDNGKIRFAGSYSELASTDADGAFAELFKSLAPTDSSSPDAHTRSSAAVATDADAQNDALGIDPFMVSQAKIAGGKLTTAEDREVGVVRSGVYVQLVKAASLSWVSSTLLMFVVAQALQVGCEWFLAFWTNSSGAESTEAGRNTSWFLVAFASLTLAFSGATFIRALLLIMSGYRCSMHLHRKCIHTVLRATTLFFDSTPTGR
eukprot:SAG22_NODE_254_length_13588_cov_10.695678_5_plen_661_part_00